MQQASNRAAGPFSPARPTIPPKHRSIDDAPQQRALEAGLDGPEARVDGGQVHRPERPPCRPADHEPVADAPQTILRPDCQGVGSNHSEDFEPQEGRAGNAAIAQAPDGVDLATAPGIRAVDVSGCAGSDLAAEPQERHEAAY